MRRTLVLACAALGAAGSLPAQSVTARVGGEPTAVGYYQTVTVPITVDMSASGGQLLGSYTARLTWNPSVLHLNAYTCCGQTDSTMQGNFPAPAVNTDSAYSFGILKFSAVSPPGVGGLVTIAQLRFTNYDTLPTPLQLSFSEMSAAGTFTNLLPVLTVQNATFCSARGRWGDLDRDGNANSRDALFVLSKVVGLPVDTTMADTSLADVDADGRTTSRDALVILSYAVGIPVPGLRVLLPAAGSCGTGSARQVAILPNAVELVVNQVFKFTVQATDSAGRAVSVSGATWRSSDFSIAGVEADGTVTPRAAGTATITAEIGPGVQASATVTVIARRPNWYVDIAATGRPVQNGSLANPYEHPLQAFPWVSEGDTVRVAPGTYYWDDDGELNVGIVLQGGTPGDTTTRPVFRSPQGYYYGLWLRGGQRTVVRNVVLQNFYEGIDLDGVRNLAVEDVKFLNTGSSYMYGIYHCGADMDTVRIDRSAFIGNPQYRYGDAVYVSGCSQLAVRTMLFRDSRVQYMSDALYMYGVDSLVVLRSQITDNGGYGISMWQEYNERPALVVSHSQVLRNYYRAIDVNYMRRVVVDSSTVSSQAYYRAIDVYDADTVLVRGTGFPGDSVSASPYCYSYYAVINVYRAQRTELRDNVLTNAYCTGILVEHADRVGRVILSHNRIDGAAAYGIKASAPVIAMDHNAVRNIGTPVNYAAVSTGVYIHDYYGADSLTSLGDSVVDIDYVGFLVDSARVARIDSLYVNGTGRDSTAYPAHGVALSKGRLDIRHSRVINAGWDGITACGTGAVLRSRGNVVRGARGGGLGTWPCYGGQSPDSLFSVRDTVQQTISSSGIWAGSTSFALIDSAVVDTLGGGEGVYLEYVGRAIVRDSRVRSSSYGMVVWAGVRRLELLRDSVLASGSGDGINITLSDASASDSAIIRGTTVDGVAGFAGVYFQGAGRVLIDSSRFTNATDGIEFSAANLGAVSARITRSRISSNRVYGVGLGLPGSQVSLSLWKNNIFANGVAGVVNYASTPPTVDADSNYWGDFNGPRCQPVIGCSGLSITGDSIITPNVVFAPWDSLLNPIAPPAPPAFIAAAQSVSSAGTSSSFVTERPALRAAMRGAHPAALRLAVAASSMASPPPRGYGPALPSTAPTATGATPEQQARIERVWQRRQEQQARRAEVEARQQAEREAQRGSAAPQSPRN